MAGDEQDAPPPPLPPAISPPSALSSFHKLHDLSAKYDACLDLTIHRVAYSSLAGAFSALLLFRSPTTRWACVAFGAGVGIGTAYTECSYIFDGSPKLPKVSAVKADTQGKKNDAVTVLGFQSN